MEDGLEGHTSNAQEWIMIGREEKGTGSGIKTKGVKNQL